jgi:hypothetical protein
MSGPERVPMTKVALRSGFRSLRRFNAVSQRSTNVREQNQANSTNVRGASAFPFKAEMRLAGLRRRLVPKSRRGLTGLMNCPGPRPEPHRAARLGGRASQPA